MCEDLRDHLRLLDARDDHKLPAAAGASLDLNQIAWVTMMPGLAPAFEVAGVALGLLLALLPATARRGNRAANIWLACYAGSLALLSLGDFFEDSRLVLTFSHLAHLTDWLIFVVGPCLWMYVRRLTMHENPAFPRWLLHFIPAMLCLLILAPFYLSGAPDEQAVIAAELSDDTGPSFLLLLAASQLLSYWCACLLSLRRFGSELRAQFSSLERRAFGWLRWMLAVTRARHRSRIASSRSSGIVTDVSSPAFFGIFDGATTSHR